MNDDIDCKACRARIPLIWNVQSRRMMHDTPGLMPTQCDRIADHERRQRDVASDRGTEDGRGR
jgi:hypothetical protein